MTSFSRRKTSLSMARTAELSWLHVSNKCTNVIISILPSFPFLVATVICHGRPLLPNQSVWLSLNFFGRYFIAQSKTSKTEVSSSSSMTSNLDSSWFVERSKCDFQEFMHCLDCASHFLYSSLDFRNNRCKTRTSVACVAVVVMANFKVVCVVWTT